MIYLELFWTFFKIGAVTFGGGYAMLAVIQSEVVGHGWCTPAEFADLASLAQMTPGPLSINTATFVGMRLAGLPGALTATLAFIAPSLLIAGLVSLVLHRIRNNRFVDGALSGIRAASIGLLFAAVLFFAENSFLAGEIPLRIGGGAGQGSLPGIVPAPLAVFVLALTATSLFKLKPLPVLLLSLFLGAGIHFLFSGL